MQQKILIVGIGNLNFNPLVNAILNDTNRDQVSFFFVKEHELDEEYKKFGSKDIVIFVANVDTNIWINQTVQYLKHAREMGLFTFLFTVKTLDRSASRVLNSRINTLNHLSDIKSNFYVSDVEKDRLTYTHIRSLSEIEREMLPSIINHIINMVDNTEGTNNITIKKEDLLFFPDKILPVRIDVQQGTGQNAIHNIIKHLFEDEALRHSCSRIVLHVFCHSNYPFINIVNAVEYLEAILPNDVEIIFSTTTTDREDWPSNYVDILFLNFPRNLEKNVRSTLDAKVRKHSLEQLLQTKKDELNKIKEKSTLNDTEKIKRKQLESEFNNLSKQFASIQNELSEVKQKKEISKQEIEKAIGYFKKSMRYIKDLVTEYDERIRFFNLAGSYSLLISAIGFILYMYKLEAHYINSTLAYFSNVFLIVFPIIIAMVFFSLSSKKLKEKHVLNNKVIFIDNMEGILLAINELSSEDEQKDKTTEIINKISNNLLATNLNSKCHSVSDTEKDTELYALDKLQELMKYINK